MEKYKGYSIKVFWDQECFSWLYDICDLAEKSVVAQSWGSFEQETECIEAAKERINNLPIETAKWRKANYVQHKIEARLLLLWRLRG